VPRRELSAYVRQQLRCPACRGVLADDTQQLACRTPSCGRHFPIVDGIPLLVDDEASLFSIAGFLSGRDTTFHLKPPTLTRWADRVLSALPDISDSPVSSGNFATFRDALLRETPAPRVLVIGGSIVGEGMEALAADPRIELVSTDVSFGPQTALICDAHSIPFADETFDGAIVQAVLEHTVDPHQCVAEVHRVMKLGGVVYAETPFMQQVHMGGHDFTRFTHSGHRRLFRQFSEIASGPSGGPGMALAWSYQYFLLSFTRSKPLRALIRAFSRMTSFYLKYLDRYLLSRQGAIDAASGFFFIGRKEGQTLSDRDLIHYYRGAIST
jgi:uncharacterized protein YbaR (Trm112 family)